MQASEMAMQGLGRAIQGGRSRCKVTWKTLQGHLTAMQGVAAVDARVAAVDLNVAVGRLDCAVVDARWVEWRFKEGYFGLRRDAGPVRLLWGLSGFLCVGYLGFCGWAVRPGDLIT